MSIPVFTPRPIHAYTPTLFLYLRLHLYLLILIYGDIDINRKLIFYLSFIYSNVKNVTWKIKSKGTFERRKPGNKVIDPKKERKKLDKRRTPINEEHVTRWLWRDFIDSYGLPV